jgi:hypothetical protein
MRTLWFDILTMIGRGAGEEQVLEGLWKHRALRQAQGERVGLHRYFSLVIHIERRFIAN